VIPDIYGQCLLILTKCKKVQAVNTSVLLRKDKQDTYNWSPLKSPYATILSLLPTPIGPALSSELPLNRFGGNGHIAFVDNEREQKRKKLSNNIESYDHAEKGGRRGAIAEIRSVPTYCSGVNQ
jgi:hypothetical protein